MYIQPNSNIHIFHNVPLCESYEDTMDFSSVAQQWSYFADNYYKYGLTKYYYQRASVNSIKVEKKYEDLYDCNYMAFNNISYENKVFYCFIKELKYINDNVTEIVYEIDPLQTWMFDYQLGECFVEREHTADDAIGANLIPEDLATGDYAVSFLAEAEDLSDLVICLFATIDEQGGATNGTFDQRMYSGLYPVCKDQNGGWFDLTQAGVNRCIAWLNWVLRPTAVKMAVVMPKYFADRENFQNGGQEIPVNTTVLRQDGTPVRNNKCLCYPYNFIYVSNNNGRTAIYNYEYFVTTNDKCLFMLVGDMSPNPSVLLVPTSYKGLVENYDESLYISGYPQIAFDVDAFKAWLAQNVGNLATSALTVAYTQQFSNPSNLFKQPNRHYNEGKHFSGYAPSESAIGMGGNILKYGGIHGVIAGVVGGAIAATEPPQASGTQQGAMLVSAGIMNFTFYNKRIRPEFATIIDDYFQMFGYACHKVKTPSAHNRVKWDYVKTVGCVVHGDLPADEANRIKNLYDNGIRFWHYGATMYDYDTNNNTVL